ncbi:hypothetical protein Afil01_42130 [Actinorhabdospora filicis]|uniref:Uncharacterized protein n=1 Tax=Actinorhabdospora filicis TaxID=1785913 RepID=A0A9W6SRH1_9ACTN|nr:hypothetical protein [Actinorhabdospora filicis]GLZ79406.1 hypothetical protein Afil01_42130 [Actinorhabdospora filicis]
MSDSSATALLEHPVSAQEPLFTVPDSIAAMWVSTSRPVTATGGSTWSHVPADVASWVAPPVTFTAE